MYAWYVNFVRKRGTFMALLAAYNIAKSYGDRVLFSSVNFELQAKSRTGLVGANGTGKTTLFRLLAGQGASEQRPDFSG